MRSSSASSAAARSSAPGRPPAAAARGSPRSAPSGRGSIGAEELGPAGRPRPAVVVGEAREPGQRLGHAGGERVGGARDVAVPALIAARMMAAFTLGAWRRRPRWRRSSAGTRASGIGLAVAVDGHDPARRGALRPAVRPRSRRPGVVALRLALAALMLWPFARPRLRGRSSADLAAAVALGRLLRAADAGLLRGDLADPAGRRGDDRVPRPAGRRPRRLAPGARRRLGAARRRPASPC